MSIFTGFQFTRSAFVGVLALFSLGTPAIVAGSTIPGSVSLAWDPNPESDVAGYKIYWGQVSRLYTQMQDTGNVTETLLSNLAPGTPYFCAVTAYNAAGQESAFSQEITVISGTLPEPQDTSGRLVLLEAESGQLGSPMAIFNGGSESWVDTASYSQLGWTKLTFDAPVAGDYHVWCRVKAPTASNDSFFVMADSGTEEVFHVYGTPTPPEGTRTSAWIWRRIHVVDGGPRPFTLDQASHTLRFRVREPGTLLDRIVLSSDPDFVPTDALPRSGNALAVTGIPSNQALTQGATSILEVTAAATGPVAYQWFKNGSALPGANGPSLPLENVEVTDGGNYSVTLVCGTATTSAGPISVAVSEPILTAPVFQVKRLTVNPDRSLRFEVEGELSSEVLVYASSDLVSWTLIGQQLNNSGLIDIADPSAAGSTRRYYRLTTEAPGGQ